MLAAGQTPDERESLGKLAAELWVEFFLCAFMFVCLFFFNIEGGDLRWLVSFVCLFLIG